MRVADRFRLILTVLGLTLVTSSLGMAQDVTKISFMDWWGPPRSDAYLEIIDLFESSHPNIEVEYIHGGGALATAEKALVMAAAGAPADIVAVTSTKAAELIQQQFALDLTSRIARDIPDVDRMLIPGAIELQMYQGKIFGLPKLFNVSPFFVNTALLEEAALAVPERGWSKDEFREYLKKLTRFDASGDPVQYGVNIAGNIEEVGWFFMDGGRFVDEENGTAAIDRPEFTNLLQWVADLKNVDQTMGSFTNGNADFAAGRIAFYDRGYISNVPTILNLTSGSEFRWQSVYHPQGEAGEPPTTVWAHPIMIAATTPHPDEAWEFLKFLVLSPEANEIKARYSIAPSARIGVANVIERVELPDYLDPEPFFRPHLEPTSYVVTRPNMVPGYLAAESKYIAPMIQAVINGEKSATLGVQEIIEPVNTILSQSRKASGE